ncbi:MAG: hypothetical protein VXB67_16240, partial [Deltaproteobacteria bacterium]
IAAAVKKEAIKVGNKRFMANLPIREMMGPLEHTNINLISLNYSVALTFSPFFKQPTVRHLYETLFSKELQD